MSSTIITTILTLLAPLFGSSGLGSSAPTLPAPTVTTVGQGERLHIPDANATCSWAFFDGQEAYTAAHCFPGLGLGAEVTNQAGVPLGHLSWSGYADGGIEDIAIVTLNPNVDGENQLSGDTLIPAHQVHDGMEACYAGQYSGVQCGTLEIYYNPWGADFRLHDAPTAISGDSGGTFYIPGQGTFGVLKGSEMYGQQLTVGNFIHDH